MIEGLAGRLATLARERTQALPALHLLHDLIGYLSPEGLEQVAVWLHIPQSDLYAVATSYSEFRLRPLAPGAVLVCTGLSCRIAGSAELALRLREQGRTIEETECLFVCGVAPALEIDGEVRGRAGAEASP